MNMTATKERPILFNASTRWIKIAATRIGVNANEYVAALNRGEKICGGCKRSLPRNADVYQEFWFAKYGDSSSNG